MKNKADQLSFLNSSDLNIKRCGNCKQIKPATLDFFYSNRSLPGGLAGYCKPCSNNDNAPRRARYIVKSMDRVANGEVTHRECRKCHQVLPLSEFGRSVRTNWGHVRLCRICHREKMSEWRAKVKAAGRTPLKDWKEKLKLEVFNHYCESDIPHCKCCDTNYLPHLAIDHIAQNGAEIGRKTGIRSGPRLWIWLRDNNWPDGFRVLCHNCNFTYYWFGKCDCNEAYGKRRQ